MFESMLFARTEANIQQDFNWERRDAGENAALLSPDAPEALAERELGWIADDFADTDRLGELTTEEIGAGRFGCVYRIEGTDILVKRHFPEMYYGGYEGDNVQRAVSRSSMLRDLRVNLALERGFEGHEDYTTPQYLGHLMLDSPEDETVRHYTLMTDLEPVEYERWDKFWEGLGEEEKQAVKEIYGKAVQQCRAAMRMSRLIFYHFDIYDSLRRQYHNLLLLRDEDTGRFRLGVIDQGSLFQKPKKISEKGEGVRSYHNDDPNAPWLPRNLILPSKA